MDIKIIAVGKVKERAYLQKIEDYADRIRYDARLAMVEIKDSDPETEGARIIDHLKRARGHAIALDERGKLYSSLSFAAKLGSIPGTVIFIIGGPQGLSPAVKAAAHEIVGLSPLTFPHDLARLLVMEQLYRALSILKNRAYHK